MLAALTVAMPANADDSKADHTKARKLFIDGDYKAALELFDRVVVAEDSPNAQLYKARCLRELGRLAAAYDAMALAVRGASERAGADARFAATRDAAIAELDEIQARVGRVVIEVESPPDGLAITLNGVTIAIERLGAALGVAPGAVVVEARAPGEDDTRQQTVAVSAGAVETVRFSFADARRETSPRTP